MVFLLTRTVTLGALVSASQAESPIEKVEGMQALSFEGLIDNETNALLGVAVQITADSLRHLQDLSAIIAEVSGLREMQKERVRGAEEKCDSAHIDPNGEVVTGLDARGAESQRDSYYGKVEDTGLESGLENHRHLDIKASTSITRVEGMNPKAAASRARGTEARRRPLSSESTYLGAFPGAARQSPSSTAKRNERQHPTRADLQKKPNDYEALEATKYGKPIPLPGLVEDERSHDLSSLSSSASMIGADELQEFLAAEDDDAWTEDSAGGATSMGFWSLTPKDKSPDSKKLRSG